MSSWFKKAPLPYLRATAKNAQHHLEDALAWLPGEDQISDKIDRELRRIEDEPSNPNEVADAVEEIRSILLEFEKDRNKTVEHLKAVESDLDTIETFDNGGKGISHRITTIERLFVACYGAPSADSSREHDVLYRLITGLAHDVTRDPGAGR